MVEDIDSLSCSENKVLELSHLITVPLQHYRSKSFIQATFVYCSQLCMSFLELLTCKLRVRTITVFLQTFWPCYTKFQDQEQHESQILYKIQD